MRNVSDRSFREKAQILFSVFPPPPRKSCRLGGKVDEDGRAARSQMTVQSRAENMRFACRMSDARIQTHAYNI
jgi:hypothetical protein